MRLLLLSALVLIAFPLPAQDITQQSIQMQQQMADQQTQQMIAQQNEQAAMDAMQTTPVYSPAMAAGIYVAPPHFSIKSGVYSHPLRVRITDRTRNTVIYYTTHGWTPTVLSRRYIGPITVPATATLQAVALLNGALSSTVTTATYTILGSKKEEPRVILAGQPVPNQGLDCGTGRHHVLLTFTRPVASQGLQVGDDLPVVLKRSFREHNAVIVPKGTPVLATVTQTDRPGLIGAPAEIAFSVWSLKSDGKVYPLSGSRTFEGPDHQRKARYLAMIPYVGVAGIFIHGGEAVIPQGATFTASIEKPAVPQ